MSEELNLPLEQPEVPTEALTPEMPAEETAIAVAEAAETVVSEEAPIQEPPAEEVPSVAATEEIAQTPAEEPAPETPAETREAAEETPAEEVPAEEESTAPAPEDPMAVAPYHQRYYLRYKEGKRTKPLDLEGTKAFLQGIGFDGGELRQAREGKNTAENLRNADSGKGNQMRCSYCGTEIAGVDYYRLPDGRLRCTSCSSSLVTTKAEVEELCKRVISNMDSFFGATIDVPVSIQMMDERKLKKKVGIPLGTRDEQSMLILGVAFNKKKDYRIVLENGAPRISLIATFAHELTHIWQYTHWDNKKGFKKCPKNNRLLIYEGMAKWAELQYLYLIGETAVAKREELITLQRQDEYGIGFRLYADRYPLSRETMCCEETPFTPDRYPFDDDKEEKEEQPKEEKPTEEAPTEEAPTEEAPKDGE